MPRLDHATRNIAIDHLQGGESQNEVAPNSTALFSGKGTDSNKLVQRITAKGVEDLA